MVVNVEPASWLELLPKIYRSNPKVALLLAPESAAVRTMEFGKTVVDVLEWDNGRYGLQVVQPKLSTYEQHEGVFRKLHIPMADPLYIGPIEDIPQKLLITDEIPLVLIHDTMWRPYFMLRAHVNGVTKLINDEQHS